MSAPTGVLLLSCPDQRGIVAAVASFLQEHGGNIIDAQQHTDAEDHTFFQRVEFELADLDLPRSELADALGPIAERFAMHAEVRYRDVRPRVALLASQQPHCINDLLVRTRSGELDMDVPLVISNHDDHRDLVEWMGIPYHHVPAVPGDRRAHERQIEALLADADVDLVVLARYMQILTADFVQPLAGRIINIHHSFLPSFIGARPYHQAHARGVKLIGVTAHYVTADLDEGPIIDQDVIRVSHRDGVADLQRHGRDLEVVVLARAVRAHLEHRVLINGRRTVVFD